MTIFAFEGFYFIKHKGTLLFNLCFMALFTRYIRMFSVKRELRFCMIETGCGFEDRGHMTPAAVGNTVYGKLPFMNIGMAIDAPD